MTNSKTTRKALLSSALALTMCVAMLIATTFAWFTDTASTSVNKIQAGTLDVALEMNTGTTDNPTWVSAEGKTLEFKKASTASGTEVLWEPGCTYELPELRVVNNGNLALKYKIAITGITGSAKLNEAITWTMNIGDAAIDLEKSEYQLLTKDAASENITISEHMQEDAGNEYQGLSIDGIGITVYAAQLNSEYDSEGNTYDKDAAYPMEIVSKIENAAMTAVKDATAGAVAQYTYANSDTTVKATVPANAVADDSEGKALTPSISIVPTTVDATANTAIKASGKNAIAYDIKVTNLVENNTEKITVEIYAGKNLTGIAVYHNGNLMSTDDFSYDKDTGKVTIRTASFSTFSIACDKPGTITVTPETVQSALDNAAKGTTIKLSAGNYGTLYFRQSGQSKPFASAATSSGSVYVIGEQVTKDCHPGRTDVAYMRTLENITIIGCEDAKVDHIEFMAGDYKYAEDGTELSGNTIYSNEDTVADDSRDTYWYNRLKSFFTIKNLTFKNIDFTGTGIALKIDGHYYDSSLGTWICRYSIDGLHFDGCLMSEAKTTGFSQNNMLLRIIGYGENAIYKNVSVSNCTVKSNRLLLVDGVENLTVTNNKLNDPDMWNIHLSQGGGSAPVTGNVIISGNTSDDSAHQFIRIGDASKMNLTITNNTVTNYHHYKNYPYIHVTGTPLSKTVKGNSATAKDNSKTCTIKFE